MNNIKRHISLFTRSVLTLGLVVLFSSSSVNYQNTDTNAKYKSVFIYNFTKNIEWPQNYKSGNFIIGILGKSSLYPELSQMASTKKAGSQPFEIKSFSSPASITKCHILIVSPEVQISLNEVLDRIKNYSTLLITEKAGMARQGSAINFVVKNNRPAFEINKSNAEKHDLKVSSTLLPLAIVVE